jgi:hypothetical protein
MPLHLYLVSRAGVASQGKPSRPCRRCGAKTNPRAAAHKTDSWGSRLKGSSLPCVDLYEFDGYSVMSTARRIPKALHVLDCSWKGWADQTERTWFGHAPGCGCQKRPLKAYPSDDAD